MKHILTKNISCTDSSKCADDLRKKIENKLNIKLINSKTQSITIYHVPTKHIITVETDKTKQQIEDSL